MRLVRCTEHLLDIEGAKLTALELQILAYVAGECSGILKIDEGENSYGFRESLDQLVLAGFLERDQDISEWLDTWRVPDDMWEVIGPHTDMINAVIDTIGEV